jgi:hypothetical protein
LKPEEARSLLREEDGGRWPLNPQGAGENASKFNIASPQPFVDIKYKSAPE